MLAPMSLASLSRAWWFTGLTTLASLIGRSIRFFLVVVGAVLNRR